MAIKKGTKRKRANAKDDEENTPAVEEEEVADAEPTAKRPRRSTRSKSSAEKTPEKKKASKKAAPKKKKASTKAKAKTPAKGKKGKTAAATVADANEDNDGTVEAEGEGGEDGGSAKKKKASKKGAKKASKKADGPAKDKKDAAKKKAGGGKVRLTADAKSNAGLTLDDVPGSATDTKIISWNIASLKAVQIGDCLGTYLPLEKPDILCVQETKLQPGAEPDGLLVDYDLPYSYFASSSAKKGYAGTGIFSKNEPLSVSYGIGDSVGDSEGRTITAEFDSFYVVNTYVPNSGGKLERLGYRTDDGGWDEKIMAHIKELEKTKPVVWCGDLNVAIADDDVYAPSKLAKTAGFTPQERASFQTRVLDAGMVDVWKTQHPDECGFSFFSYRVKNSYVDNKGWRLDYFVVSESLFAKAVGSFVRRGVAGSDHVPIGLVLSA